MTSCDIGQLGPKEGAPVYYHWNPIYNMLGVLPWLFLAAAYVLLKENRNRQALWIFLPVVLFRALWMGFAALTKIPSEVASLFISLIDCLLIGFTLNWLLAERIKNRNRFFTWLLSLLVFAAAFVATLVNHGTGMEMLQVSLFIGLTVGILLVSFALAGFMCRKKFSPVRFSLWMAFWVLLTTSAFITGVAAIQAILAHYSFMEIFLQILMASLIYSAMLIAALLPFEIVLFVSPFWRKRFDAVFRLKTNPAVIESIPTMDKPSE